MPDKARTRVPTLYATVGLPASGKSTKAKEMVLAAPAGQMVRINKDDAREQMHAGRWAGHATESQIIDYRNLLVVKFLTDGVDVVVDDTNLQPTHLNTLAHLAFETDAKFEILDFTDVDVEECIRRDALREASVGEGVIRRMVGKLKLKRRRAGHDPLIPAPPYDPSLPTVVLVDLDGTLAAMGDRRPYDWAKVGLDTPRPAVVMAVQALMLAGVKVVAFSGRDGVCRPETEKWLIEHVGAGIELFMRTPGDNRRDSLVKHEMFHAHIAGVYNVAWVYDDRDQVVRTWRAMGIDCFQVAPGAF